MDAATNEQDIDSRVIMKVVMGINTKAAPSNHWRHGFSNEENLKFFCGMRQPAGRGKHFKGAREVQHLGFVVDIDPDIQAMAMSVCDK